MNKIFNKFSIGLMLLSFVLLAGCNDAPYDVLRNQAFILQTNTNANSSEKLTVGNEAVSTSINVRLSDVAEEDCSYRIIYDTTAISRYNLKNETSYTALPEDAFSLSSNEVSISAGSSVSSPIDLTVQPLSQQLKDSGKKYAIGFRLESTDGKSSVLESGSEIIYILDQVVIQPVVVFNRNNFIRTTFQNSYTFNEWTVEFNVNKEVLGTGIGQYNNQVVFGAYPSEIYIRFGDAPIEGNRLQIKTQGTQMNSQMLFSANKWYHIAFVCTTSKLYLYVNGQLDNSMDIPGNESTIDQYFICNSGRYTIGDAMYSEFRFWSKARTQAEIQNNMYSCDPTTPGFIFYFKFNEGSGNTFHDASGNGNDATTYNNTTPEWVQDVRIDGK